MKKIYLAPELKVVRLNMQQFVMATSSYPFSFNSNDDNTDEATEDIEVD